MPTCRILFLTWRNSDLFMISRNFTFFYLSLFHIQIQIFPAIFYHYFKYYSLMYKIMFILCTSKHYFDDFCDWSNCDAKIFLEEIWLLNTLTVLYETHSSVFKLSIDRCFQFYRDASNLLIYLTYLISLNMFPLWFLSNIEC